MKKSTKKLFQLLSCLGIVGLYPGPSVAGVDCDGTPHTRLETSICGSPLLRALDQELTTVLERAQQRGLVNQSARHEQRNRIARQCKREPDVTLVACLMDAEVKALARVTTELGGPNESLGADLSADANEVWRYRAGVLPRIQLLQKQLKIAETNLRRTGDPALTVATIVGLLDSYRKHEELFSSNLPATTQISELQKRLTSGCENRTYGSRWRLQLRDHGLTCQEAGSPPVLYSSSNL